MTSQVMSLADGIRLAAERGIDPRDLPMQFVVSLDAGPRGGRRTRGRYADRQRVPATARV